MVSEEDKFWARKWSDICGACGRRINHDDRSIEITIKKRDYKEETLLHTDACSEDCADNVFALISKDPHLLKRYYHYQPQAWKQSEEEDEKYNCGWCGADMHPNARHVQVEACGECEDGAYLLATNRYCTYRCYRKAISLGKEYIDAALGTFDGPCIQKRIEGEKKP